MTTCVRGILVGLTETKSSLLSLHLGMQLPNVCSLALSFMISFQSTFQPESHNRRMLRPKSLFKEISEANTSSTSHLEPIRWVICRRRFDNVAPSWMTKSQSIFIRINIRKPPLLPTQIQRRDPLPARSQQILNQSRINNPG
jgi:hypothetical protein